MQTKTTRSLSLVAASAACLLVAAPALAVPQSSVVNVPPYQTHGQHHDASWGTRGAHIASGTQIHARLENTINSHRAHTGDRFTARIDRPVLDSRGHVAIPAGAQIVGTVRGADQRMFSQPHVALSVDGVRVDGRFVAMNSEIVRSEPDGFRAGLRMRNYVRLEAGSPIIVRTTSALPVASLRDERTRNMGGGPKTPR